MARLFTGRCLSQMESDVFVKQPKPKGFSAVQKNDQTALLLKGDVKTAKIVVSGSFTLAPRTTPCFASTQYHRLALSAYRSVVRSLRTAQRSMYSTTFSSLSFQG